MKNILYILLFIPVVLGAQTTTESYVKSVTPLKEIIERNINEDAVIGNDDKIESVTYYDGLGRPKQSIALRAGGSSSSPNDIVTHIQYDLLGRVSKEYLPFASQQTNNGSLYADPVPQIGSFYDTAKHENTKNPYAQTIYELSPLNRIQEQAAPGNDWKYDPDNYQYENPVYRTVTINPDNYENLFFHTEFIEDDSLDPELITDDAKISIDNGVLKLDMDYYFSFSSSTTITTGIIRNLNINPPIEYLELGFIKKATSTGQIPTKYKFTIENNDLIITDTDGSNEAVSQVIFHYEGNVSEEVEELVSYDAKYSKNHTIRFDYRTNAVNEVKKFKVDFATNTLEEPSLQDLGFYEKNELYITLTKDENWQPEDGKLRTSEEFKDKQGRVILKRTHGTSAENEETAHDTYYVYDELSNLTFVISPKVTVNDGVSVSELAELCYQYKYDERNRLVKKKIPGKEWESIVYDKLDRPVLTQDANQAAKSPAEWLFTKYDVFGRIAYTGIYSDNSSQDELQLIFDEMTETTDYYEQKVSSGTGFENSYYTNANFPSTGIELLMINYYDDYNFDVTGFSNPISIQDQEITLYTRSLTTGSKVKVLDTEHWITSVSYFDQKARPIYVASKNTYLATTDIVTSKLSFYGSVLLTRTSHQKGTKPEIVTVDVYEYDDMNRLISQKQCIGDSSLTEYCGNSIDDLQEIIELDQVVSEPQDVEASMDIILSEGFEFAATVTSNFSASIVDISIEGEHIVENTYDELGQLESKEVGGGLQTIDYKYNVRGWLTDINDVDTPADDLFTFKINYNQPSGLFINPNDSDLAPALYNGNISETIWKTANDNIKRAYGYQYDALNRIKGATDLENNYNVSNVTYDRNGNVITLGRKGFLQDQSYGTIDYLIYGYQNGGNRLQAVVDYLGTTDGFNDRNLTNQDYEYDPNGNMEIDRNKGITGIIYNHFNLPISIDINNTDTNGNITYIYDATGAKLKKIATEGSSLTETEYAGNYIYKNEDLQFFNHPEGYIEPKADGSYTYVYQYKDHLGNIRLSYADNDNNGVINAAIEIREEKNYYPFGLQHKGYNTTISGRKHNYGFNGKEEQNELNFNTLDYGARFYDPAVGRWFTPDALAEKYYSNSPYTYALNNPVIYIDPDGNAVEMCCKKLKNVLKGFNKASRKFNNKIYNSVNSFLRGNPITETLKVGKTTVDNATQFVSDGTGVSDALGFENKTRKSVKLAVATAEQFPSMTGEQQGMILFGFVVTAGEILVEKKIPSSPTKNRVKLRKKTKEDIKENAPKTENGDFIDPNTGQVIPKEGPFDIGHKTGQEWRDRKKMHEEQGSTRKEVIEAENNPNLYQIEDPSSNRSHKHEKKDN